MRKLKPILLLIFFTMSMNDSVCRHRCTGSAYCSACTNCSGCRHCAKEGGTCGVCAPQSGNVEYGSQSGGGQKTEPIVEKGTETVAEVSKGDSHTKAIVDTQPAHTVLESTKETRKERGGSDFPWEGFAILLVAYIIIKIWRRDKKPQG